MAKWHYFDENGNKVGPVRGRELKLLAQQGSIAPNTRVEDENGQIALAKQVTGLTFPESTPTSAAPNSYSVAQPESEEPSSVIVPPPPVSQNNGRNPVPTYFYTDENGYRFGPIDIQRLQTLAYRGTITAATPLETDTGHKGLAGQIPGLKFNPVISLPAAPAPDPSENSDTGLLFWILGGASVVLALIGVFAEVTVLAMIGFAAAVVFMMLALGTWYKKTGKGTIQEWSGTAFSLAEQAGGKAFTLAEQASGAAFTLAEQATRPTPAQMTPPSGDSRIISGLDYRRNKRYFNPNQIGCLPIIVALLGVVSVGGAIFGGANVISDFNTERRSANERSEQAKASANAAFDRDKATARDRVIAGARGGAGGQRGGVPGGGAGNIDIDALEREEITRLEGVRNEAITGAERARRESIAGAEERRNSEMPMIFILFLGGLGALAFGAFLIVKTLRDNSSVTDAEMDQICENYVERNLKSMALKKLGIDEDQVQEIEPIQFHSYYFKNLSSDRADILQVMDLKKATSSTQHKSSVQYKMGKDKMYRASNYKAAIFFFSVEQVYYYGLTFSLLGSEQRENTSDSFYGDIVDISTVSDTVIYRGAGSILADGIMLLLGGRAAVEAIIGSVLFDWFSTVFGTKVETIKFDEFVLTTSGSTTVGATISDLATAERSIQGMKNLVRDKKQQLQRHDN